MIGIISICSSNGPTGSSTGASSADDESWTPSIPRLESMDDYKDDKGGNDSPSGKGGFGVLPNFYPNDLDFFGISYID
jgi:hypothetical protein